MSEDHIDVCAKQEPVYEDLRAGTSSGRTVNVDEMRNEKIRVYIRKKM